MQEINDLYHQRTWETKITQQHFHNGEAAYYIYRDPKNAEHIGVYELFEGTAPSNAEEKVLYFTDKRNKVKGNTQLWKKYSSNDYSGSNPFEKRKRALVAAINELKSTLQKSSYDHVKHFECKFNGDETAKERLYKNNYFHIKNDLEIADGDRP